MAGAVFLRNLSATRRLAVPLGNGWARLALPGATVAVPRAALALPAVQQLLQAQLAVPIGRAGWDAGLRQRAADRADMPALIRKAEQQRFDALLAGSTPPRRPSADRVEWVRQRLAAGSTVAQLAGELGITRQGMDMLARRHGLLRGRQTARDEQRPTMPPRPRDGA